MATQKGLTKRRRRRAFRVRHRVRGTSERPRLTVFRSNRHIAAQFIDDEVGRTLCQVTSLGLKLPYGGNIEAARTVGTSVGEKAVELKITRCGFDRGRCRYHGRVKALAEAVRKAGVEF